MSYFGTVDPNRYTEPHGSVNYSIFYDENTPIPGASASAAIYLNNEYPAPGVHEDNEGFFVYEGTGFARVGEQEQAIRPGCCFYAPAGTPHQIKKASDCVELKIFLFHF